MLGWMNTNNIITEVVSSNFTLTVVFHSASYVMDLKDNRLRWNLGNIQIIFRWKKCDHDLYLLYIILTK